MTAELPDRPQIEFPAKVAPLFEPHPYKIIYGGRGKGASWSFARALLELGKRRKLFIVCGREIQNSIKESVHKLIADQIETITDIEKASKLGQEKDFVHFNKFYEVKQSEIVGRNGTKFTFVGIKNNVSSIKSMEAIDIFAVFEADAVSKDSWDKVLPTVRRDPPFGPFKWGSEVWVEFNPELDTDETYKRWVIDPPIARPQYWETKVIDGKYEFFDVETKKRVWVSAKKDEKEAEQEAIYHNSAIVIEMSYRDNPFFPQRLRNEMLDMKDKDPDNYRTVWEGKTRKTLQGAIFAKELETAINEGRLSPHIKLDPTKPVTISFDLGDSDLCAWWAWQQIGMEHNAVDYYGNSGFGIDHYLEMIEDRKLKVKTILLPHDAAQAHQSARGAKLGNTIEKQVRAIYGDKVKLVPRVSVVNRINAARALFPRINIAEGACSDGVKSLTRYRYAVNAQKETRSPQPLHDVHSNPADAFTYYPVWLKEGQSDRKQDVVHEDYRVSAFQSGGAGLGWMA